MSTSFLYNDYYPFGMLVPMRNYSSPEYRYGFNGMEKDNNIKGNNNSYDFGARMLDPRVGRWLSTDGYEMKYPSYSTYTSSLNNPLFFIDPDGNDIVPWITWKKFFGIESGPYFHGFSVLKNSGKRFYKAYIKMANSSKIFGKIISRLESSDRTYKFQTFDLSGRLTYKNHIRNENYSKEGGHFDPNSTGSKEDPFTINLIADWRKERTYAGNTGVIFEETFHAAQNDQVLNGENSYTRLAEEVEAKLVKNIEGFASSKGGFSYEYMNFDGRKEIFSALRDGKKLSIEQVKILRKAIKKLADNVSKVYKFQRSDFSVDFDLEYFEKLYNQKISYASESIDIKVKIKSKK